MMNTHKVYWWQCSQVSYAVPLCTSAHNVTGGHKVIYIYIYIYIYNNYYIYI